MVYYVKNHFTDWCGPETCSGFGMYCLDTDRGPVCNCSPGLQKGSNNSKCVDYDEVGFQCFD